ncbi:hypothetical protein Ciccas_001337 [Cichlidogyrus casuarinus]|uniref:CSD domain-containing protein n=1 Tax=Cichlidogyrus casuarinus TaxID=1844966 RepID=A0ABD2QKA2_9PLAT
MEKETAQTTEAQAEKRRVDVLEVLIKKCTGTVKWYSHKLLYGFISREDSQEDVFVHRSAIAASNAKTPNLRNGEAVEFSVVRTTNGVEAFNVTGPNGDPVQGFQLSHRPRRRRPPVSAASGDAPPEPEKNGEAKDTRKPRRKPRRGRGSKQPNGTHSEGDVYYEVEDEANGEGGERGESPSAGRERRVKRGGFSYGRRGRGGGFRGGRGAKRTGVEA